MEVARGGGGGGNFGEDWPCTACGFGNWARNWQCKQCQAPKPEAGENANLAPLGQERGGQFGSRHPEEPVIDHMAVMRRQIEEMQEKALEGRFIAEDILGKVLADVVAGVEEGAEGFASSNNFARCTVVDNSGFGAASPDYEAPGSPEYIPPQNDMGTEVAETAQRFKCSICGFISEGIIYQL